MIRALEHSLAAAGRRTLGAVGAAGGITLLLANILRCLARYPVRWKLVAQQLYLIGVKSQFVVLTTGAFVGAVFAAQVHFQFVRVGMQSAVGPTVSVAMCRELGPVFCCLLLAGRVGAAMAAELSSMKNTEQLDALRALGVYPVEYLAVPRFLAMLVSAPILTGLALVVGIACGYLISVPMLGVDGAYYWDNTIRFTGMRDVGIGLSKGFLFGIIIAVISCYKGFNPQPGTAGVGRTTTEAVVISSLAILVSDFFFTFILNSLFLGRA
ncbi:MAG: ABC transporter permease [Verrucomicrobiales bacterium]|jgi:phospholipid/cholesterol/gamma-HCH transport system permease protein|nr:ABC transporter permease [Verrucomicrobiales bacterium]